ncbi:hypothetical protein [Neorhizobium alkalisoli]|uniref:hypothetical protein n=1 Tax=Neorhizobium alkalisoli TaxID=528178 RepID=UPI00119EDCB4|nr:hypothetical protein [Neorhizobium alkalisoli]
MTDETLQHADSSRLFPHNPIYFNEGHLSALKGRRKASENPYKFGDNAFAHEAWNAGFRSVAR